MNKFLVLPLLMLAFNGFAQQHCGTTFADQEAGTERLKANIAYAEKFGTTENVTTYVPVFFHLTAKSDGSGRASVRDAFNVLCTLNADYAEHDIQFYLSPHPTYGLFDVTINSNNVANNQSNAFLMKLRKHNNAVNYYVVDTASTSNQQPGGAAAYYSPANDWVVIDNDYTGIGDNTAAHETGHFFSLRHTFYGWESDAQNWQTEPPCFESADPGWPCAPVTSPGGVPSEKADGSNCSVASDLICDTPPDYNFGYCAQGCVAYNGGAKDPTCQAVDPMENNFMSYYFECADYEFTPQQEAAVKADIASSDRNFLDNTFTPAALNISTPADMLVSPAQDEVLNDDDTAVLTWNAVPGATYYFVEVDITTAYISPQMQFFIVENNTSVTVTGLSPNKKYNWRVRPFNEYYVCANAKVRSFKTGMVNTVDNIDDVSSWNINPNPVEADRDVTVNVATVKQIDDLNLQVTDATGRIVYTDLGIGLAPGQTSITVPTTSFAKGVYFVTLVQGGKKETKRLVIAQ